MASRRRLQFCGFPQSQPPKRAPKSLWTPLNRNGRTKKRIDNSSLNAAQHLGSKTQEAASQSSIGGDITSATGIVANERS
jgi:hypothetical protein